MLTFIWILQIILAVLLIFFILLHSPKGDGFASMGGMTNMFSSQKNAESGLNKLTMWIAIAFLIATFITGFHILS